MSDKIVVVGHLSTSSAANKQKVVENISAIAAYSLKNEPNVTKYCIAENPDKAFDVYVIEEYADQKSLDDHMACPPVKTMIAMLTANPTILAGAPDIATTCPAAVVTKASVEGLKDPFIVYASLDYKSDTFEEGLQGWKDVVENTRKTEDFTPVYMCLKDSQVENRVRMVEVYDGKGGFDRHCATAVVGKKVHDETRLKANEPDVAFLKKVAGYWYK